MPQRLTTSFVNTVRPGAYFDKKVKSTPVGVSVSGNIVIMGEADGGAASFGIDSAEGDLLKDNYYSPDQLDRVVAKYISGPIVDAFNALTAPSGDDDIVGAANRIYIVKTNKGSKASAIMDTSYGTVKDKNYGIDGNKYAFEVSQSLDESAPEADSDVIAAFGAALDGASFTIRVDGGAESIVTLGTGGHADRDALVTELDGLLPAGISCVAGDAADTIKIQYDADASANSKGYGKSIELIDSTAGDLALLSLSEGLYDSAQEPEVQVDITRQDTGLNESFLIGADIAIEIGYEGTSATMDVSDAVLSTSVVGGSGADLSINLSEYPTLSDLADFINSQTGYSAIVVPSFSQRSPIDLDDQTGVGICSTGSNLRPGRVKVAAAQFALRMAESTAVDFEAIELKGLPDVAAKKFLQGGLKGSTSAADIVAGVNEMESIDVNFVVPLFSRDASEDIAEGLTDSGSGYTIDAINALVKSHVLKMSTVKIKKHRSAVVSVWKDYKDIKERSGSLSHPRVSVAMQKSSQVNSAGEIVSYLPWHSAVIAAGMQLAGFYKAIVNKLANVISFEDPSGFDSGSPGDIEDALESGLLFMEKLGVGSSWVSDQTTYGKDANFVFNSIQAMYASDLVALDLTASLQRAFVGKSLADVDPATASSFIASKMDSYKKQKLIASSDDAPLGFKGLKVNISGPIMEVRVEIKLATAIYFIPITLEISQVQSSSN